MDTKNLLSDLDRLLRETYALWEPGWVTFNWRGYTYDHVQRVRGLAVTLYQREQTMPDPTEMRVVEMAALLHDITKPYDGEYLTDGAGKRVVNAHGHWLNEVRRPQGSNEVTALYDRLNLAGSVHHESGATLAYELLRAWGLDEALCGRVAETIRDHLQPRQGAPLASLCLYDADTLDANIGLPAFVRNIYINLHFYDARKTSESPALEQLLADAPLDFLRPYIREKLPAWSEGKQRDFIPRLATASARALALTRLERLTATWAALGQELDDYAYYSRHGRLAVVLHYMRHRDEPSIADETTYLAQDWLLTHGATPQARDLIGQIEREIAGTE
jgi:hypothetical protein